jgi:Trk K+ transport system NAD-binding subunit
MLIGAESVDEVNLLSCLIASKMGVKGKIARVRNPEYYHESSILKKEDLGVDLMINPEFEVAEEITRVPIRSVASDAREEIMKMDAFVATTSDDDTNIISCLFAKHLGIKKTIALVDKTVYMPFMQLIGIDPTVNIRLCTGNAILRFLRKGKIFFIAAFHGIEAEAIGIKGGKESRIVGKLMKSLNFPDGSFLAAVINEEAVVVPSCFFQCYSQSILRKILAALAPV